MSEISIRTAIGRIHIFNEMACEGTPDADGTYEFVHKIPSLRSEARTVRRGVRAYTLGMEMASCLVVLPGEAPIAHSNAMMRHRILYLGSGDMLCGLDARELSLLWSLDLPSGFANGLYFPPLERSVIAIGSSDATCIEANGTIRWSFGLPGTPEGPASLGEFSLHLSFRSGRDVAVNYLTGATSAITDS